MKKEVEKYYLAFDTETGALEPEEGDLLTVYFCLLNEDFQIVEELDLKVKPDGRLPIAGSVALSINKIDLRAHLEDPETITYTQAKTKVLAMLQKYVQKVGKSTNIRSFGYNTGFDIKFVQFYVLDKATWRQFIHYKFVDVMQNVDFLKDCSWFPQDLGSLGSVIEYLSLPKRVAHTAKDDVLMTIDAHKKILEIMRSKKDGGTSQDLISLLEAE